jgi:L-lactate dehydrogenase complex protein LldE
MTAASISERLQIAVFTTCIGETMFSEAARATARVLSRLGHAVAVPAGQTCCGQMHLNSGYGVEASALGERFRSIFDRFDVVVAPSASCVGHVRSFLQCDNVYELSELLVGHLGIDDVGARFEARVVYHPTCHSLRVTRVGDAPLRLLHNVRDLDLIDLPGAGDCCGFGGVFAVKNAETSSAILADKCDAIESTSADVCTALDGSCLLQIGGGLSRRRSEVRVLHLAEILAAR